MTYTAASHQGANQIIQITLFHKNKNCWPVLT